MLNLSQISEILSRRQSDEEDHYYRRRGGGRSRHGNRNYHQEKEVNLCPYRITRTAERKCLSLFPKNRKNSRHRITFRKLTRQSGRGNCSPFLNAKAEQHTNRIDNLNSKIATQESKISKHTAKIEKLTARADKLEDTNRMLKNVFGDNSLVQSFIKKNEQKISDIRENKIPNRQQKIRACQGKIGKLTAKRDIVQHKLNRVVALNDTIKSFTIGKNAERRAAFTDAINRLNAATVDCLTDKKTQLESKKKAVMTQYNDPKTDVADKFKLQDKLNDLSAKINSVDEKIAKIKPDIKLAEKPPELVDATIKLTSDKIADNVENGNISIPEVYLDTVTAAQSVESLDKDKINELAGQVTENPLATAEMQLEDDADMIDGIINNGSKSDLEQTRAELLAQLAQ